MKRTFDVIIVGGSYSGVAAGMALGRALRNTLIIDSGNPCNKQTPHSHNFLTHDGKTPKEISTLAKQQVLQYDTVQFIDGSAISATKTADGFDVSLESGETFASRKLILATGIKDLMPDIPGFAECWGISVLHCPYCHGYEVRRQPTGILANGDTAYELASLISNWTSELTIFTNGNSTLTQHQLNQLEKHQIGIDGKHIQALDHHNGFIQLVIFKDGSATPLKAIYSRVPFVQHSAIPELLGCAFTSEGYISTDPFQKTTVPGVYASGDNSTRIRTVANAVALGTTSGLMVNRELIEEDF
ncbi:NAD(P)/FAD-dependent oxidoreductase [Flavihumibacter petaseus]|uniref:Putative oxidoreductase n=1 Tax=Flavihumibacter petaseus NBRC 106054 TaxID=1220578 RepID=A0A0E9N4D9_9BACT|nr:NAD(P)/FAD-dependent oxidoreductase [Flavihumibacter petaseus]GAO44526.1 putative oxidoreductase [Flavihumibacter petaseus NBRC 106054]